MVVFAEHGLSLGIKVEVVPGTARSVCRATELAVLWAVSCRSFTMVDSILEPIAARIGVAEDCALCHGLACVFDNVEAIDAFVLKVCISKHSACRRRARQPEDRKNREPSAAFAGQRAAGLCAVRHVENNGQPT